jgi:anti-sigma-K factor RskA
MGREERDAMMDEFVGSTKALLARLTEDLRDVEMRVREIDRAVTETQARVRGLHESLQVVTAEAKNTERCREHSKVIKRLSDESEQRKGAHAHQDLSWRRVAVIAAIVGAVAAGATFITNRLDRATPAITQDAGSQ